MIDTRQPAVIRPHPPRPGPGSFRDPVCVRRRVERLEHLLERAFVVPGLRRPLGLDALLGLVPVAGDVLAGAIGLYLLWEGRNLGLSKWQMARMLANIAVDLLLGSIPLAGDLFDLLFRSNSRNRRIILRHLERHHPAGPEIGG